MARNPTVSEADILAAAEAILSESGGRPGAISARAVAQRTGGCNKRVRTVVAAWQLDKRGGLVEGSKQPSTKALPVPDAVSGYLDDAVEKIIGLGPLFAERIEAARRSERDIAAQAAAAEQRNTDQRIETMRADLKMAQADCEGYAEDLDNRDEELSLLTAEMDELRAAYETEQETARRLAADYHALRAAHNERQCEVERTVALYENTHQFAQAAEARLANAEAQHREDLTAERQKHHDVETALRCDLRDANDRAHRLTEELLGLTKISPDQEYRPSV